MPDEDLIRLISAYDEVASQYELANAEAKHANARALECAELIVNTAAPLKKRCSPNIPKRYLRASSGNVYEVTADSITKIEIKGGK